jgi:polar amino acid transport system substrate-binding protein
MRRITLSVVLVATGLFLAACGDDDDGAETAETPVDVVPQTTAAGGGEAGGGTGNECTAGKTLDEGVLTVATATPAFSPWVENDAPETGEGFEAAVAYAVAGELGYSEENVTWVRTTFDEAIQPGEKNFDFNLQQFSITPEREETVTFSDPYYTTNQAVVGFEDSPAVGATTVEDLKGLKFGAQAGTTSLDFITEVIQPDQEPFIYDDNAGAKAALEANQIDAIVLDLPTAFFVSAVEIEGTSVIGQFPADAGGTTDEFGLVFDKDNPLVECVNEALASLKESGELEAIEQEWLSDAVGAPVISVG